jgi:hypothetical protein
MTLEKIKAEDLTSAVVTRGASSVESVNMSGVYHATCYDSEGNLKWSDTIENTVVTAGKNSLLDVYLRAQTQITTWYFGIISSVSYSAIAAGDTPSSHSGWREAGNANAPTYSEGVRQTAAWSAASSSSITTSSAASFSITSSGTVKGAFLISVATKDATTGTLYSAGLFTVGDKIVSSGDTINVTYTASA